MILIPWIYVPVGKSAQFNMPSTRNRQSGGGDPVARSVGQAALDQWSPQPPMLDYSTLSIAGVFWYYFKQSRG